MQCTVQKIGEKNGFRVAEEEDVGPLERSEHVAENRGQLEGQGQGFSCFLP